jgi:hydrogenase assembly chaperone HypC/HupF
MCHAIPVRIVNRNGNQGIGERDGLEIDVDLSLLPEAKIGDMAIVHVGIALCLLSENEQQEFTEFTNVTNAINDADVTN